MSKLIASIVLALALVAGTATVLSIAARDGGTQRVQRL